MRRRKAKVVWIPTTPEFSADATGLTSWNFAAKAGLDYATFGDTVSLEVPVVLDGTQSGPLNATSSLADIESSGYRLRRIVGKIFVFVSQDESVDGGNNSSLIGVTAGFIIRRSDPGSGGSLAGTIDQAGVNPATIENSMDPWIWRRSWILGTGPTFISGSPDPLTDRGAAIQQGRTAGDNIKGLSALDGPHIDQKTARIIGPEERLFLDVSATVVLNDATSAETNGSVVIIYETRVLGSMRTSSGNRRNASR